LAPLRLPNGGQKVKEKGFGGHFRHYISITSMFCIWNVNVCNRFSSAKKLQLRTSRLLIL